MKKLTIGNVTAWRVGNDMHFECTCGEKEVVENYENSVRPKKFSWRIDFQTENAACFTCGKEYTSNIGGKYK